MCKRFIISGVTALVTIGDAFWSVFVPVVQVAVLQKNVPINVGKDQRLRGHDGLAVTDRRQIRDQSHVNRNLPLRGEGMEKKRRRLSNWLSILLILLNKQSAS